jgi:DNA-binding NarL/FixJ family response regulator
MERFATSLEGGGSEASVTRTSGTANVQVVRPTIAAQLPSTAQDVLEIAVVDGRTLVRECFEIGLKSVGADITVRQFSSVDEFLETTSPTTRIEIVILGLGQVKNRYAEYLAQIASISSTFRDIGIIVTAETDRLEDVTGLFQAGARGFISSSDHIDVAMQAIHLVKVGGTYIPSDLILLSAQTAKDQLASERRGPDINLTPKQLTIANALRKGKANKSIAYDLNMCESTVKVHVRSIMKKLKARNRTEAAYMINRLLGVDDQL